MPIDAIIWDFDGVLLDNELLHLEVEIETVTQYGIPLTLPVAGEYLGYRLDDYFRELAERYNVNVPLQEMIITHHKNLILYYREIFPMTPHADEVVKHLSDVVSMGIATSRERDLMDIALKRFSLNSYFTIAVCGEDVTSGKPDPEPYLKAASLLNVSPQNCVVVEDSIPGFQSAKGAGMTVIARKAGHNRTQDFSLADFVVEDLKEILSIIDKLSSE